jgi:anti-sigma B factor antagonist
MDDQDSELQIAEEQRPDGTPVLRLSGELDLSTAPQLRERLEDIDGGLRLDLSDIAFMDSTGVSLLIGLAQRAKDDGASVELVRPTGEAWRVIELTGIEDALPFVDG